MTLEITLRWSKKINLEYMILDLYNITLSEVSQTIHGVIPSTIAA